MQELNNTAIDESHNIDCKYFNECYLQVRNYGKCFSGCKDYRPYVKVSYDEEGNEKSREIY